MVACYLCVYIYDRSNYLWDTFLSSVFPPRLNAMVSNVQQTLYDNWSYYDMKIKGCNIYNECLSSLMSRSAFTHSMIQCLFCIASSRPTQVPSQYNATLELTCLVPAMGSVPRLGQTKVLNIGTCPSNTEVHKDWFNNHCFSLVDFIPETRPLARSIKGMHKNWFTRCQYTLTGWCIVYAFDRSFHWDSIIKSVTVDLNHKQVSFFNYLCC